MPASPLSTEQKADANRLKALFTAWQQQRKAAGLPSSQDWASDQLAFGQSAMSQYLNGRIPLNADASVKFAALIGCGVHNFSPTVSESIQQLTAAEMPAAGGRAIASRVTQLRVTPGANLLRELGAILRPLDATDREIAKALLNALVADPEKADDFADRFENLLGGGHNRLGGSNLKIGT